MSTMVQSIVICDAVYGGTACGVALRVDGHTGNAERVARSQGWDIRRHEARCPICVQKKPLPPEEDQQ
jgi:hypothetical protein